MVTLVTMDKGHSVKELFTPENIAQWDAVEKKLQRQRRGRQRGHADHRDAVQRRARAAARRGTRPRASRARSCSRPRRGIRRPRARRSAAPTPRRRWRRITAIPAAERTLDNPDYVDFLLHDNQGNIRKPLLANFPDDRHAQMVVRLPGNASIKDEGKSADRSGRRRRSCSSTNASIVTTGAPVLLKNINDYLTGGMLTLGRDRDRDHGADPARAVQRPVAAARARSSWSSASSGRSGSSATSASRSRSSPSPGSR